MPIGAILSCSQVLFLKNLEPLTNLVVRFATRPGNSLEDARLPSLDLFGTGNPSGYGRGHSPQTSGHGGSAQYLAIGQLLSLRHEDLLF